MKIYCKDILYTLHLEALKLILALTVELVELLET